MVPKDRPECHQRVRAFGGAMQRVADGVVRPSNPTISASSASARH